MERFKRPNKNWVVQWNGIALTEINDKCRLIHFLHIKEKFNLALARDILFMIVIRLYTNNMDYNGQKLHILVLNLKKF